MKKAAKRITSLLICMAMLIAMVPCFSASAATQTEIDPLYTYESEGYLFEKVSHPDSPVETADGIIDYAMNGQLEVYVQGESETGNGDRGQSYSYAAATYGDWVYINTMYGGLGITSILKYGALGGLDSETANAVMNTMYNGNLYLGEPDGQQAGGVLLKFNVKTGETVILMSRYTNGLIPTFRNVCVLNDKMYFVGMVLDTSTMESGYMPGQIDYAIMRQDGQPCIYEIDPATDEINCIYQCVDYDGYLALVQNNIFPSTRAISTYQGYLVSGGITADGSFLCISDDPSAGQDSFKIIADMDDLFNYPAYHRTDVNAGGGIYQTIEYNNSLYVVICTGSADTLNDQGTLRSFAIVRGDCDGDPMEAGSWTWTAVVGDQEKDGARYTFGIDPERISCGACTLEVYNGYLYIGEYNDVSNALQGFVTKKNFTTQATNLDQSINLYRMDADENIEMIVGDPTGMFPEGGISGLGSGYESHMNQYTWQMEVYEGKLYISTMDTTTLLEPIAQFTNGDLISMSEEEWQRQINYIQVLLELLLGTGEKSDPAAQVDAAIRTVSQKRQTPGTSVMSTVGTGSDVELTEEQIAELIAALLDGSLDVELSEELAAKLEELNELLLNLTELIETTSVEAFAEIYAQVVAKYNEIVDQLPEGLKTAYNMIISFVTLENIEGIVASLPYLATSEAGFDVYVVTDNGDTVDVATLTTEGFGDRYNHGLRIFAQTTDYLVSGTANPFYGTQLWRLENTEPGKPDIVPEGGEPVEPAPGEPAGLPFVDVTEEDWFYDAVYWAWENGVTTGTSETTFSPYDVTERCQIVTYLWRMAGEPVVDVENPFTDISEDDYYYDAVLWAVSEGITYGTSATTFSPHKEIERCELITFLWRAAGSPIVEGDVPFVDVDKAAYYYDALIWAVAYSITNGTSIFTFSPFNPCERAAVVTFLYRFQKIWTV